MSNEQQQQQNVLTPEKVQQLIAAVARLKEIGGSTIIDPRNEAEQVGLKKFIGCWVAVRQEYEPLVQTLERIANRVFSVRQSNRQPQSNEG